MTDEKKEIQADPHFISLLMSLEASCMQAMGKIMNPVTNEIESNLPAAKVTIDMLGMLEQKTAGNLNDEEDNMLKRILYQLRMNYVEEVRKEEEKQDSDNSSPENVDTNSMEKSENNEKKKEADDSESQQK